ncbi:hypothetical protein [Pantoea sp. B65]|uniref:hypothetical protein n=1 Tax=Pantoea sp. B65 TaxID=2813359 RepID=UPI0039B39874
MTAFIDMSGMRRGVILSALAAGLNQLRDRLHQHRHRCPHNGDHLRSKPESL